MNNINTPKSTDQMFILYKDGDETIPYKVTMSDFLETNTQINFHGSACEKFLNKTPIEFDGRYKPDSEDEYLYIEMDLPENILNPISGSTNTQILTKEVINNENIKPFALIYGNQDTTYMQAFDKSKVIKPTIFETPLRLKNINLTFLFQEQNTVRELAAPGLILKNEIDALYADGKLIFTSYYTTNKIIPLKEYHEEATNEDIFNLLNDDLFETCQNQDEYLQHFNHNIRRTVARIMKNNILQHVDVKVLFAFLNETEELSIQTNEDQSRIIIPNNKEQIKHLLALLEERVFKGIFTNQTKTTNSTRNITTT